ncbi:MAG: hypothetical protein RLZZ347_394 [Candidatus Parcubacteria bacterium]|jgi:uncharacterized repeat protein (TIGR01451 family)
MTPDSSRQKSDGTPHRIDEVNQSLYSANFQPKEKRRALHLRDQGVVRRDFGSEPIAEYVPEPVAGGVAQWSFTKKLFVSSLGFFGVALLVALYVVLGGGNVVSTDNVDIKISGPVSINGGEELVLDVSVVNNNNTALELTDLVVTYPEGTRSSTDLDTNFTKYRESLGDIPAQSVSKKTIKAILFGEQNSKKQIKIGVEYRVAGSNAIFYKEKEYEIVISSSPLSLAVNSVTEANAGQTVDFTIDVTSNSTHTLNNVVLSAEYPFGFGFKSASPDSSYGTTLWRLGDIAPNSKRTIVVHGIVSGQDGEERVFHFNAGIGNTTDEKSLGAVFLSSIHSITIRKPLFAVDMAVDGNQSAEYVTRGGRNTRVDVLWSNNTSDRISNATIEVSLKGDPLDKGSISVDRGFYRSIDNTIVWDASTVSDFASIEPGATGRLSFNFSSRPSLTSSGPSFTNPDITLTTLASGQRVGIGSASEPVTSTLSRRIKISSDLILSAAALYSTGPFKNTGAIPPKVDTETTYTILWTLSNSSNAVTDAKVSSVLPSYVKWLGVVSPSSESVTYNPVGGEVVWDAGDVPAGTGFSKNKHQVAFQVSFTPSLSQLGSVPKLTNEVVVSGTDSFTNSELKDIKNGLTTRLSTDPSFVAGNDAVVK